MTNKPNFSISLISITSGKFRIDEATSSKKTAKGAAKSVLKSIGVFAWKTVLEAPDISDIKVIIRPIEEMGDSNYMFGYVRYAKGYIAREVRHGASVFNLEDIS